MALTLSIQRKNVELLSKVLFFIFVITSLFVSPAVALFLGIALALTIGAPYVKKSKKISKYFLQASVV